MAAGPTAPVRLRVAPEGDQEARLAWYASIARWAPSKHNTQPWRFVVRPTCLEVWADPARMLPVSDPRRRELSISCGAALHLATVAARAAGHRPVVTLLPDGSGSLLARLEEEGPWPTSDLDRELLSAVPERRTDRGPLDATALPPDLRGRLAEAAAEQGAALRFVSDPGERAVLAGLVAQAGRLLARRARLDEELASWLREGPDLRRDGLREHPSGGAWLREAAAEQATARRRRLDRPLLAVLCSPGEGLEQELRTGGALAAVLLTAHCAGASAGYLNGPVEEPSVRELLTVRLALPGTPQLVLRLGAGGTVPAAPRRSEHEVVFRVRGTGPE